MISQSYNYGSAEDTEWHVIGNLIKNLLNVFSMAQDYKWVCELMSQLWSSTKRVVILIVLRRRSANLLLVWMNNLLVEQVDKKINLRVYIEIKKKLEKKKQPYPVSLQLQLHGRIWVGDYALPSAQYKCTVAMIIKLGQISDFDIIYTFLLSWSKGVSF